MANKTKIIKDTASEILASLKIEAEIMVTETADEVNVEIIGQDTPLIIGVHGQNLQSIEHLVRIIANRQLEEFAYINVDSAGYKEKRRKLIEEMASKAIAKVLSGRSNLELEAMNANERKIVHTLCQPVDGISSESAGIGADRRVVIKFIAE